MGSFAEDYEQKVLDAPMPWIGMYIAAASVACSLAMAADAFNGFRGKKLWFPCKYFSLNAFSLTLLAVAMKLPVDLKASTLGLRHRLARISSLVLMSTAMCNFVPSMGSMDNNEIILNLAALAILVITILGNVFIHNFELQYSLTFVTWSEEVGYIVAMLVALVYLCSLAIMVPSAKRYIESRYNEMHKRGSNTQVEWGRFTIDELRVEVKRYWVMAATSSPQFVIARSAVSCSLGLLCLLMTITLAELHLRLTQYKVHQYPVTSSYYRWSINWIFYVQSIGVGLGTIAPLLRWYVAVWFKIQETSGKNLREEFKIESYWTLRLVEWRESSLTIRIRRHKCRKLLHDTKRLVLNICIGVQILFVLASKSVLLISAKFGNAFFSYLKNLKSSVAPNNVRGFGSRAGADQLDLRGYVLLLEGEGGLPTKILNNICNEVDEMIHRGGEKQTKNLTELLNKSVNFNGVREFDSNEVPSLHSQEPPNCWSMPVVTLTSIAIALPNVTTGKASQLLRGVTEGLSLVKLIEKTLDKNGELESIRNIADVVWVRVELYRRWLDTDLQAANIRGASYKDTLQNLSSIAKKIVNDFAIESGDFLMQNPLNWPFNVIAASSMYRIAQTILLAYKDVEHQTDDELFERLSIIISDILAACLTNLVRVITMKCHENDVKKRQKSVGEAAVLLGECEDSRHSSEA